MIDKDKPQSKQLIEGFRDKRLKTEFGDQMAVCNDQSCASPALLAILRVRDGGQRRHKTRDA
ncbi:MULTISPECIES: hypothetical protein [Agrobacterium]|jgi:hypothetical protein|uniref:Uncharacterized protein n=1 Tax=Agrobacterium genomosp. 2 str. CFBP 5494 TaxID=1183436 RepID=A0A9W5B7S4_9HYPH|nr:MULTISPECIES: hypothetical protein [Agrobacterium]CUX03467.1 hypothetical protein AGR2A_pb10173 [Agrobacterium genomosp. 2 str. CFBP 5494]